MTQEQMDFNKRCAEFLGIVVDGGYWVDFKKNMPSYITMSYGGRHHIEQLCFHEDWNWIMEVVNFIERLEDSRYYVSILESDCSIIDKVTALNEDNPFMIEPVSFVFDAGTKREAVVQTIDKFLIWYNGSKG